MLIHSLYVALLAASVLLEGECLNLVYDKAYKQIAVGEELKHMCNADELLAGCQVRGGDSGEFYDLSGGKSSALYLGAGLESGQCGYQTRQINVTVHRYRINLCRARARDGGWQYAETVTHYVDNSARELRVAAGPRMVLADLGDDVTFTYASGEALGMCHFKWPGQTTWINNGSTTTYSINPSFAAGSCQLTLLNVQSDMSGIVIAHIMRTDKAKGVGFFMKAATLIVKEAPSTLALTLSNDDGEFTENDVMKASCFVSKSRPVARVSWLLGDDVIPGDAEDYSTWPWEFEAGSVTWKLSRTLSVEDDGKALVCRVHHVNLPGGWTETKKRISVGSSFDVRALG